MIFDQPPFASMESERALLSCLLSNGPTFEVVSPVAGPAAMHWPHHARVYEVIRALHAEGVPVDIVTVSDRVMARGLVEVCGGLPTLLALLDAAPSHANAEHYAKIVAACAARRAMHKALTDAAESIATTDEPIETTALRVASELGAVAGDGGADDLVWYAESTTVAMDEAERASQPQARPNGAHNPIDAWAEMIPHFRRGEVHVIAARPAMGKSALARKVIEHNAEYGEGTNEGVGVFSLEMKPDQIAALTMSHYAHVPLEDIVAGLKDAEAWRDLENARGMAARLPILMCRRADLTVDDIVTRAHRMRREMARRGMRLSLIAIDYLQLIRRPAGDRRNTADIVGDQSRALKLLAMGLDVPVLLLSQLNRDIEKRDGKARQPRMSDLRDSGSIEQDAATITFIDRPCVHDPDADPGHAELVVAKNRYGRIGTADAIFHGPTVSFSSAPSRLVALPGGR